MFDFEKFKRLCGNGIGIVDITEDNNRKRFLSYLNANNVPATVFARTCAPYVYWSPRYEECWGWGIPPLYNTDKIYTVSDFETATAKSNSVDILNFLGV